MKRLSNFLATLFVLMVAFATGVAPGYAQSYPYQNPTYIATATLDAVVCTAACDVVFVTNGTATTTVRIAGTGTGVSAVVQGSEARNGTIAWSNMSVYPVTASATAPATAGTITGVGLWRTGSAGMAQIRVHLTAVTGSVSISMAGDTSAFIVTNSPSKRTTYSASIVALAPAASATDFLTLTGSATTTVRVTRVSCSGISTAAATATVEAVIRSTADSSGTPAAMTAVPHDSNDPAATATVTAYTVNPTTGTLVGIVRAGKLLTTTAATSAVEPTPLSWDFNPYGPQQEIVLRGTSQVFALNGAGASFASGAALNCDVSWVEDQ